MLQVVACWTCQSPSSSSNSCYTLCMLIFPDCCRQGQRQRSGVPKTSAFEREVFNLDVLTSLHDPDQQASVSHDVTTDADKFEKILTPLEHPSVLSASL